MFDITEKPENRRVIGCRTVLANKYRADGSLEKRKARIVARGFTQRPGIDFGDTFAPVARLDSIRLLLALAVKLNMMVEQLDVTSAYLNGTLKEDIYMDVPEGFEESLAEIAEDTREEKKIQEKAKGILGQIKSQNRPVCILNKALYGLKQAGKQWNENSWMKN